MRISRDRSAETLNLSQEQYVKKVLAKFRVNDAKTRTTLLENHIKLSKEQSVKTAQEREHMALVPYASAAGSLITSLCFGNSEVILQGFVDVDLSGDVESSMSTSRYIYTVGGTAHSWMPRIKICVALSSTEAEYVEPCSIPGTRFRALQMD
ncbi:hypothetical protein CQW23_33187 [Capsicum baccatum]|uniref:Retrovirus-related Pol polyprotein from transposon TNT 1-94 n=1 Tax=Capsicum baccatum TaxID=33114 RepID=A0A2G2V2M0_CAPBA|nr:hypothetical protein CQW23_33187 [Capsicum baccatum]